MDKTVFNKKVKFCLLAEKKEDIREELFENLRDLRECRKKLTYFDSHAIRKAWQKGHKKIQC